MKNYDQRSIKIFPTSTKKNIGRISGFAWGLGFVGGLISLIIIS